MRIPLSAIPAVWLLALFALCARPVQAAEPVFKVGAAKVDSTPSQELCTGGYGLFCGWKANAARPNAIGGTDRLYTRAMVAESEGRRLAIVTTSAIGIFAAYKPVIDPVTKRVIAQPGLYDTRLRLARETGLSTDHIFIQSDHSHRSPDTIGIWGGVTSDYLQKLQDDMVQSVKLAVAALEPAELYVGAVDGSAINCVDSAPADGVPLRCTVKSLYNYAPNQWVDDEFRVLQARRPGTGERIATFANYSPHATVLEDIGTGVFSGDWTGWLAAMLDDDASGAVGLATVGTLGRTDFESGNNSGSNDARNLNRERAARARLQFFLDTLRNATVGTNGVKPLAPVTGSGIASSERFLREMVTNPILYGNYAPFVGVPATSGEYPTETHARIDRSTTQPWLTGNVMGTFAGAFRIGDLFFATAPGEEFPNAQKCLRDGCSVGEGMSGKVIAGAANAAPQMHFFLGATNDFLGYMGPAATYDQVVAQGATYFFCPPGDFERQGRETLDPLTQNGGYEAGRLFDEGSCPDHFILMASPTIGDHVNCAIQNAALSVGFGLAGRDPACEALTAADSLGAPPVAVAGGDDYDSGQRGIVGMITDFVADAMATLGSLFSGSAEAVVGYLQQTFINLVNNLQGVLLEDDDASVATTLRNVVENPQGDGAATLTDLVRDAGRLLMGFEPDSNIRAGVGVVDMTPDVGYAAGQYADTTDILDGLAGGEIDPYLTHKSKKTSYGVQSRLTARAIVVEGNNGKRVALIKTDNYLAQDALIRRVAQILQAEASSIGYEQILHSATHNHSSAYSSTPSWGVWVFEDVFDPRFFENQARRMAQAIQIAERNLKPARMGATSVRHKIFKGNVVRLNTANDGTPAGYPLEYGDLGLVVMRFDELTSEGPKPLAVWVNWGQHPESLNGHDLHTADYLSAFERFVDREIGAPLVFSQGDVGSAENSGNKTQMHADDGSRCGTWLEGAPVPSVNNCAVGEGVLRVFDHTGYVAFERNVRFLADGVIKAWKVIGGELPPDAPVSGIAPNNYVAEVQVPLSTDFPVDYRNYWAPGPLSHPYPSVSNCKTDTSVEGDVGVPVVGLPDCGRFGFPGKNEVSGQAAVIYATMKAEGVPVPDHYDASAFTGVEENLRIYLQTFRLGEVLLASCACEAQVDLILNLESRADQLAGNIYNGFDWACLIDGAKNDPQYTQACAIQQQHYDPVEFPTGLSGTPAGRADGALIAHMRAQIHNDARGWDAPEYVLQANSEPVALAGQPTNFSAIKGNFTHEELPPARGYKLPVGLGHSGDYVGYTVSYREYMNRDSYRKALTAYGPHTADYMVTRLVRMAGAMKGGPELQPEPQDALAQADEARQVAQTTAFGQATAAAYDAWQAALPMDVGPAVKLIEPKNITHFNAARFRWRGGNTQLDNPVARVEIQCDAGRDYLAFRQPLLQARCAAANDGDWLSFADMTGEVQTRVHWPLGVPGVASVYAGQFAWEWTASFEAYRAFPARLGDTPLGSYRFVVKGCINDGLTDPASNGQGRAESLLTALLPDAAHAPVEALLGNGCAGGSRPYQITSNSFTVSPHFGSIPRSYSGSSFPYVQNRADNAEGDSRICESCSFRPWASDAFGGAIFDTDSDGVADGTDLCVGTPAGQPVNADGCSASQRDSDGDGLKDNADQCPLEFGLAVNRGCPDSTPNIFSFTSVSGVSQNTVVSSNVATIAGMDAPADISLNVGEYRINGGAYTNAAGTIVSGQTVQVRHSSAATANTATETSLNIGGVVGKFRSTTAGGADTDPDGFNFPTKLNQPRSTVVISDPFTPVGYNSATTVKVGAGTEYSINCTEPFTAAPGTISPGASICVRHTTASSANTLRKTSVQIGKTVAYFSTRTAP